MQDRVDPAVDEQRLRDIMADEAELFIRAMRPNVAETARDQIVDADNSMTAAQKPVAQMRADEAGAARDQYRAFHFKYQSTDARSPASSDTFGRHPTSRRMAEISAQVKSGSPGRRGP